MPHDVAIVCGECGKAAPRGMSDPRPDGGYDESTPERAILKAAWRNNNYGPKALCEPCYKKVTMGKAVVAE
jgi:hypothetical protein